MTNNEHGGHGDDSTLDVAATKRGFSARRFRQFLPRLFWPLLYLTTVSAIVWWYEFGSGVLLSRDIQGKWREVQGKPHNEEFVDAYFIVNGSETWSLFPGEDTWDVYRSRLSIRPAEHFYLVTREFAFDWGKNTRSTEYIMYRRGDQLILLHGLARLDPRQEFSIQKLRRVEHVPDQAVDEINAYLKRVGDDGSDR